MLVVAACGPTAAGAVALGKIHGRQSCRDAGELIAPSSRPDQHRRSGSRSSPVLRPAPILTAIMRSFLFVCALVALLLLEVVAAGRRQSGRSLDGRRAKRSRSRRPHRARALARARALQRRARAKKAAASHVSAGAQASAVAHVSPHAFAAIGALSGAAVLPLAANVTHHAHNASSTALPAGLAALHGKASTQRSCPYQADTGPAFKDGGNWPNQHYCAASAGKSPDYLYWCAMMPAKADSAGTATWTSIATGRRTAQTTQTTRWVPRVRAC